MSDQRNDVLSDEVAREFGCEICVLAGVRRSDITDAAIESLGRIAFKRALEIAEQEDFGE